MATTGFLGWFSEALADLEEQDSKLVNWEHSACRVLEQFILQVII